MPLIGIFYGSTDGHTQRIAFLLRDKLAALLPTTASEPHALEPIEVLDIAEVDVAEMEEFDFVIAGVPTWNTGQLQRDWDEVLEWLDEVDLTGKRFALFGLGDQLNYPRTFVDALFFVADKLTECGGTLVGAWSTEGYDFTASWAVQNDQFLGLVLDEHNQPHLTEMRVSIWAAQLKVEFGL